MAEFKFPDVGEGLTEGVLVKWLVAVGDAVKTDQPIAQVETDKAVVDIPLPFDGTVSKLNFAEGDMLTVGQVMLELDGEATVEKEVVAEETKPEVKEVVSGKVPVTMQTNSAEILALPKVRHAAKEKNIDLSSVTPSGKHGEVTMSDLDGGTAKESVSAPVIESPAPVVKEAVAAITISKDILATPGVRRRARELGVSLDSIKGSGANGAILLGDLEKPVIEDAPIASAKPTLLTDAITSSGAREKMSSMRKIVATKMVESQHETASVTFCDDADVTHLALLREHVKESVAKLGIRLSYLPFFVKASVAALKKYPHFNAQIDMALGDIIGNKSYNIGIAVDAPKGLFVPVVKDANEKGVVAIAQSIGELAGAAREGTLSPADMSGGTFTISSVGGLGGTYFTPIINYPQIAILGIGKIEDRAVVRDGNIVIRKIVPLSLTFDHRAVDGADAARFMKELITLVEDPELLLVE
jgi:pyruvate dehydrogenase E2 component (dihydrolipoamide acetyltransferase)